MGAPSGVELGSVIASGTITSAAAITGVPIKGDFNISVYGTFVATIQIERSFDGGSNWIPLSKDSSGSNASYTAPFTFPAFEPERGVLYRLNCTSYTSGTATYRISGPASNIG